MPGEIIYKWVGWGVRVRVVGPP